MPPAAGAAPRAAVVRGTGRWPSAAAGEAVAGLLGWPRADCGSASAASDPAACAGSCCLPDDGAGADAADCSPWWGIASDGAAERPAAIEAWAAFVVHCIWGLGYKAAAAAAVAGDSCVGVRLVRGKRFSI